MDETKFGNGRTIGSVKAAIDKYGGGKINQATKPDKKIQKSASDSEIRPSKAKLHIAKKRINQMNEDREMADKQKSQAELELLKAKKLVRELTSQIEVSKAKAREQMKELDSLNKMKRVEEKQILGPTEMEDRRYTEIAGQVEAVKRELSKIRLSMTRLSEEKLQAENEAEAASLRISSYIKSTEQLTAEIEAANEEEVLVELAQIEACKELEAIEAQRKEESERFSSQIEETRRKISAMKEEIEQLKDLEDKLAVTSSDIHVLQQLKLIKEMDRSVGSSAKLKRSDVRTVTEDVEDAKEELNLIKDGGFQLMTSMDEFRTELRSIIEENDKLTKLEDKTAKTIKNLNSKLIKAKDKLEVVSATDEKAKLMFSNLSFALETLEMEKVAAEKERETTREEMVSIRAEIQKTESETDLTEEKLYDVMQELTEVKSAEAKALKKLKAVIENAVGSRASQKTSTITISRFEYDYLTGSATEAQKMAEKKVVAARAWTEALKASQRELKMKVAAVERKITELRLKEEQQTIELEKSMKAKEEAVEGELQNKIQEGKRNPQRRKSVGEYGYSSTPGRHSKFRISVGSPATRRLTSSTSFTVKKRRKAMLKFAKYFAGKQIEDDREISLAETR